MEENPEKTGMESCKRNKEQKGARSLKKKRYVSLYGAPGLLAAQVACLAPELDDEEFSFLETDDDEEDALIERVSSLLGLDETGNGQEVQEGEPSAIETGEEEATKDKVKDETKKMMKKFIKRWSRKTKCKCNKKGRLSNGRRPKSKRHHDKKDEEKEKSQENDEKGETLD